MKDKRLRHRIAGEAARLLLTGAEREVFRAKRKAARELGMRFKPKDLPSNREIAKRLDGLTATLGAESARPTARRIAVEALRWLDRLAELAPSVDWPIPELGSSCAAFTLRVGGDAATLRHALIAERRDFRENENGKAREFAVDGSIPFRIVQRAESDRPGEAFDRNRLATELLRSRPGADLDAELLGLDTAAPYEHLPPLLESLEGVRCAELRSADLLHHALQMFELARAERGFDEEFLAAALLHDVGSLANPEPTAADRDVLLDGLVTERTRRLIEWWFDPPANPRECPGPGDREDVLLFRDLHARADEPIVAVPSVAETLAYLADLAGR